VNDYDFCLEVVSRSRQPLRYKLTLNSGISETVMNRGLVSKDHQ